MHIEVILEVALALFALYGVFCAIQLLTELLFPSASFTLAVFVKKDEPIKDIYNRLCYAQVICARERGALSYPILVIDEEPDELRLSELEEMGVDIYMASKF